jgi:hypothetical protein
VDAKPMTRAEGPTALAFAVLFPGRAAGVLALWVVGALPGIFGLQRCPIARWLHHPCPGCGMSRAMQLLARGDVGASLAFQPLAVPVALSAALLAIATAWVTLRRGSPMPLHESRFARIAIGVFVVVQVATVLVWIGRELGFFGGPVPV